MATARIDNDDLVIELSVLDRMLAVHGSFRIPLRTIATASTEKPPGFFASLKLFGTNSPWPLKLAGTFLYHGEIVFFDYQRDDAVLAIDLAPGTSSYKHLFVHIDEPGTPLAAAQRITAAVAQAQAPR